MLKPKASIQKFIDDYGFKKCAGSYGKSGCYYLCISHGCKMLFLSPVMFAINPWDDEDPRIHKKANCHYRDHRTATDILFELIKNDYLENIPDCTDSF